jgi:chromate transporter
VLPYIYQGGVDQYQWLTSVQMMDGLALGETTPGPLIMIVAFVGFVGAWTKEIFGPEAQFLAGFAGAAVATFFTFLPSFLFIFIGGPGVEATRGDLKFSAPLSAVTAAVVGVIINLAVFFAQNTLWPSGNEFDVIAALIGIVAFVALFRYKVGIMTVIAVCAMLGLGLTLV